MVIKRGEWGLDIAVYSIAVLAFIITLYPLLFVFFMSVSSPNAIFLNKIMFFPDTFQLTTYKEILQEREIWVYYYNTVWIVVIGTLLNLVLTLATGYVLSRKDFKFRNYVMAFIVFTMFFGGGMIPFYVQVRKLGLMNTRWSQVLPFALSAWYVIIARTYFQASIPESLHEAALIDGATKVQIMLRIILPLSKPIMAIIVLWCTVGFWNSYFWALIFLSDPGKHPIQIFLVKALIQGIAEQVEFMGKGGYLGRMGVAAQIKYVIIIITILPILMVYPFLQKYFIKGVMIGSLKG